jgi:hypothetical protein
LKRLPWAEESVISCGFRSSMDQVDAANSRAWPWAMVRLQGGKIRKAELHWYEAHGIGKKKMKIKSFLD